MLFTNSASVISGILNRRISARRIPMHLRKYKCPDCDKAYSQKCHLSRHQKMECNKEPKYKCPFCNYVATYRYYLKVHVGRKHHTQLYFG